MTHKSYILSVCEGTKIDAATLAALTNTAWDEVRRKVEEYKVSGYPPEQIHEMLVKVAAYHDAAYHAVTQELVARGISIRREKMEENAIKDRADKESKVEAAKLRAMGGRTHGQHSYTASQVSGGGQKRKKSVDSKESSVTSSDSAARPRTQIDGYSVKERKVLKLVCSLIPADSHPSSMGEILENLCKADGLVCSDVIKKFDLYGRPSA